ncbi:ubiquitin-like domain-containing protein [Puerhibacterium sp. TATVAM-FAB25]|uniref:aggregation-promoting factor C-terminal-like domain-containing protein n=1 Tax=Puerhibacterium sp. TATVAM-FAB25 TaxID=3093699 RepID=UPI00397D669A
MRRSPRKGRHAGAPAPRLSTPRLPALRLPVLRLPVPRLPGSSRASRAGAPSPRRAAHAATRPEDVVGRSTAVQAPPATGVAADAPALRPGARRALHVVVVLALAGSTYAVADAHRTVTIDDDGRIRTVSAYGRTVGDVLAFQGVELEDDDHVQPAVGAPAADGGTIVVRSSRVVTLVVDGESETFETTALTVGDLVAALGERGDGAVASASRSTPLGREPVRVSTLKTVSVAVDGTVLPIRTTQATVRDVLADAGITLAEEDATSVPLAAAATDGMLVLVSRGETGSDSTTEVLPFETTTIEDPSLPEGYRHVRTVGRPGEATTTYAVRTLDGAEVERTVASRVVTREPQDEVVVVGTMDPGAVVVDPGSARSAARALAAERGWGDTQFVCLDKLWTKESGWRVDADNPSSSAYGIPQALPGSKMASAGADWRTNAVTQIEWGLGYIAGRYGTPCGAWAKSQAAGWY